MRRQHDRERPLEAILEVGGAPPHRVVRPGVDVPRLPGLAIVARDHAAVAPGVGDVRVVGTHGDVAALAAADRVPVLVGDPEARRAALDAQRAVVLLRAAHPIGEVVGRGDVIELRGRLIILTSPGHPAVVGDVGAPVVPFDHAERVARIDPEVVVVSVGCANPLVGAAAVSRLMEAHVENVNRVLVLGIGVDVRVVPGPLPERPVIVYPRPSGARILRAEDTALLGLNDRPHPIRVHRRDRDADLAEGALRQARVAADLGPAVAPVGRLEKTASRTTTLHPPRHAACLPESSVNDPWVVRVEGEIDGASVLIPVEDLRPGRAAVQRPEDAAGRVGPEGVPEHRRVDDVRVGGVDAQLADLTAITQPDVGPGLPGVGRLVDAVPRRGVAANASLAGADVDDVGVGGSDGDAADRPGAEEFIGDGFPRHPAIHCLPHTAACGTHVIHVRLARHASHRRHPPAAIRPDRAPLQRAEQLLIVALPTSQLHIH